MGVSLLPLSGAALARIAPERQAHVGWVERSEHPTPAKIATCVGSSLTLDPTYEKHLHSSSGNSAIRAVKFPVAVRASLPACRKVVKVRICAPVEIA
jgi:hypothetical protein